MFRFNVEKSIRENSEIELLPSSIPKKIGKYDIKARPPPKIDYFEKNIKIEFLL